MESGKLDTRLGSLAWQSSGQGPPIVFFAGALATHQLWRDVVAALSGRYRCVTVDLPLGGHPWPLRKGADRSAVSLARLELDCLDLLGVDDATVVVNDTAGGLLLLSLATGHPALGRVGRLVLTNCESYEHFPPASLKSASAACRMAPWLAGWMIWLQNRSPAARRKGLAGVVATDLEPGRIAELAGPGLRDRRVIGDMVAAMAGFHPQLLLDAAREIPLFDRPVLLVWGEADDRFFPLAHARRLAADFPRATLVTVPGAKTWVPVDNPAALAGAIADFVPVRAALPQEANGKFDHMAVVCQAISFGKQPVVELSSGLVVGSTGVDYIDFEGKTWLESGIGGVPAVKLTDPSRS